MMAVVRLKYAKLQALILQVNSEPNRLAVMPELLLRRTSTATVAKLRSQQVVGPHCSVLVSGQSHFKKSSVLLLSAILREK